jgi:enoyl-CoA hydratase/carnithine racemase
MSKPPTPCRPASEGPPVVGESDKRQGESGARREPLAPDSRAVTSDCVSYRVGPDHCAVITIERPEARNAVSPEVARGIEAAIDAVEADDTIRVAVLTGAPPVFSAGADLKAIQAGRGDELATERGGFAGVVRRERTKPLIAAVEGAALAGGTEIVLACDLVVSSREARFGLPEVKRGLVAAAGGLFRLGRRIPLNLALECALTGDPIDAELAHRHGLVNQLCDPAQALETALALAHRITANAPLAVRESRAIVLGCTWAGDDEAWLRTNEARDLVSASDDVREGVAAFIEKRAPVWTGR